MSNMVVRTNIFSLNAHRNMKNVGLEQRRASNRLSSGYRINSAADDAAGLAISETMRAQIRGLDQASRNAQDGQAMLLTTEGGLEEIGNMLQRVRELLVQASNDTNTQDQRTMIEQEISQLATEIGSMQQRVEFNTNRVLAMGPALDIEISENIAKIDGNNLILNEVTDRLNANRAAVADAREMLALFNNTDVWSDLSGNTRLQTIVTEALGEVDLRVATLIADGAVPGHVNWNSTIAGQNLTDIANVVPEQAGRATVTAISGTPTTPTGTGGTPTIPGTPVGTTPTVATGAHPGLATVATIPGTAGGTVPEQPGIATGATVSGTPGAPGGPGTPTPGTPDTAGTPGVATVDTVSGRVTVPTGNVIDSVAIASNASVTDLIGLLNTRDTTIMNALGEISSMRTEMTLAGRNIVTGTGGFDNSIANFRETTSSGNFVAFFQAGANANQGISYDFENVSRAVSSASATVSTISALIATPSAGSGIGAGADVTQMINWIQTSLDDVNSVRANLGAVQNRMDYTMRSLDISSENLQDSESRVRNADMAREMMRFTMSNVLQQASISMLSQANQMPNNLLQVLR